MTAAETQLDAAVAASGVHRIPLPTPFAVGTVNAYLLEGDPLTLVDTGPGWARSLAVLERRFEELGHRIDELELLLVTHQHIDHGGLLDVLAERSGAQVAAIGALSEYLRDADANAEYADAAAEQLMRRHGVPAVDVLRLRAVTTGYRYFGSSVETTRILHDGEEVRAGGRTLTVQHRPGHSPYDVLLWDADAGLLFSGDHLIARISSNPVVTATPAGVDRTADEGRLGALMAYAASLERTRSLPARVVLGGHQEPIADHRALITTRLEHQRERTEAMGRIVRDGARTGHEVATRYWGEEIASAQAFLTLSEVLGHMDHLLADGDVRMDEDGDVVRFAPARVRATAGQQGERAR